MLKPSLRIRPSKEYLETESIIKDLNLKTVCAEANCPNTRECFSKKQATFIILGNTCTRSCTFCNIKTGRPVSPDPLEPTNIANAVLKLNLSHVVITSVTRDDLFDGGAVHFSKTIACIRDLSPNTTIEVLTPDFLGKNGALEIIADAKPDVFNHNLETVERLYKNVRPGAKYQNSLDLLKKSKKLMPNSITKSGFMIGLGEEINEIEKLMDDLRKSDVDFLTIGQYLRPSNNHHQVVKYFKDDEFEMLKEKAYKKGFIQVSSSALTRSSFHAGEGFNSCRMKSI